MEYKYTGIILRKYDTGETDRIYTAYTLEAGKIRALAQSVRKPQSKLAGNLENFSRVDLWVARKKGMGRIAGVVTENNFPALRKSLEVLESAFVGSRFLERLVDFEEKDAEVFFLTRSFLETLDGLAKQTDITANLKLITAAYKIKLLDALGYQIAADACAKCSNRLSAEGNFFSAQAGGFLCRNCQAEFADRIRTENDAIKIIRIIIANKLPSLLKLKVGEKSAQNLAVIVEAFSNWIKD